MTDLLHVLNQRLPIIIVSHDVSFVSSHLKRVACLSRRLTCHAAHEISPEVISEMYHAHVRMVRHEEECPLSDQGCAQGCQEGPGNRGAQAEAGQGQPGPPRNHAQGRPE